VSAASSWRCRFLASALASLAFLLSSCSDSTPLSPDAKGPARYEEAAAILTRTRLLAGVTFAVVQSSDPEGIPHQVSVVKEIAIRRVH
jgi:hypothetical protein